MNLVERVKATQQTVDTFKGRPFADGSADCVQLVLVHARHMGRKIKVPRYGDVKSAAAALEKLGFRTLGEAMDKHFRRIGQHEILAGDIVESLGSNGFSGLMIAVGNGRTLGFHESVPHCDILQPLIVTGAWRIE
ncbi:MAG: DUF6950 family protein [Methylocystis sp.]|uniref:DUF6950 family protein n=1 Tax=Methylocystis sp. TaxID=1911079 RepID=UPI003DA39F35